MTIEPAHAAATATNDGHTYHFCSPACHDQFAADPAAVLAHIGHRGHGHYECGLP